MAQAQEAGFRSLMHMVGAHKFKMTFACLFSLLTQFFGVAPFLILYLFIDFLVQNGFSVNAEAAWPYFIEAALCVALKYLCSGISTLLAHMSAYAILYDLRIAVAEKLPRLPLGYFNATSSGEIKKVMLEDVEQMEMFIGHNLPDLVGSLLYLVLSMAILLYVDWRLALATICLLPVCYLAQALTISRNKDTRASYFTANEKANSAMVQYIQGMPVIKAFMKTESSFKSYAESIAECARHESAMCERWTTPMTVFSVALNANMLVLLPLGAMLYLNGSVSLSVLVLFLLMGLGLGGVLQQLMLLGSMLEHELEGRKRIDAILKAEPLPEPERPATPSSAGVEAKDVTFAYGEHEVLHGIAASVQPGRFLALVGPSGAGKSTLARLIPRFWDVKEGSIAIGGTDIRQMAMDDLMDRVSFVFQDIFLFNDTVEANLRVGKPDATMEEIEAACKAARCHDFIMDLPGGYRHVVGEKGAGISGGEKQRICIARALLKNAPIIVLDEATAFIDPENEIEIQKALNALVRDKTLIVVAHRLSTIVAADEILVVDKGLVAARGRHEDLLQASPLYRGMWEAHMASKDWNLSSSMEAGRD